MFAGLKKEKAAKEVQKVAAPSPKSPKLLRIGIASLVIWLVAFGTFMTVLVLKGEEVSTALFASSYLDALPGIIMLLASFGLGVVSFFVGIVCLTKFLNNNGFKKFLFIFITFPFYVLVTLGKQIKSASGKAKIRPLLISLFVFFVFIPVWLLSYVTILGTGAYVGASIVGYAPFPQAIAGTGSMYPTFPKGTGKTDKENAEQTVALVTFFRYPGGIELFGKRFFGHTLERGDIVMFRNKMTEEVTKKQYGEATGYIKRVIGLPGDKIELREGLVYLNGKPIKEPYTASAHSTFAAKFLHECTVVTVPDGKVFVMGDNRKGSEDSREFGFIDQTDIKAVLSVKAQKGEWEKNWRNTDNDLNENSKIRIDKQQYLALLNEKRKAAGVPELAYEERLEQSAHKRGEIILKFNDFSFEATRSGYTMQQAMSDSGYFNPFYGESPSQGYFTAEELLENQFAFSDSKEFVLEKDYDHVGIAEVEGELNGCPTQILVQHFAGYVPPNYSQSDVASWQQALANLREIQPGWAELKNSGEFYEQHKADIDRINQLIAQRIANVSAIVGKMEANQWLSAAEQRIVDQDEAMANEINSLADKLNSL